MWRRYAKQSAADNWNAVREYQTDPSFSLRYEFVKSNREERGNVIHLGPNEKHAHRGLCAAASIMLPKTLLPACA